MKSRNLTFFALLALITIFPLLQACMPKDTPSQSDIIINLGLDKQKFQELSSCEKIKAFAEVGYRYIDIDHRYVDAPEWMYNSIYQQTDDVNANCIKNVILDNLNLAVETQVPREEISLKVHALFYLATSLDILKNENIQEALDVVVCEKKILDFEDFIFLYYFSRMGGSPSYLGDGDDFDRAWNELCIKSK